LGEVGGLVSAEALCPGVGDGAVGGDDGLDQLAQRNGSRRGDLPVGDGPRLDPYVAMKN